MLDSESHCTVISTSYEANAEQRYRSFAWKWSIHTPEQVPHKALNSLLTAERLYVIIRQELLQLLTKLGLQVGSIPWMLFCLIALTTLVFFQYVSLKLINNDTRQEGMPMRSNFRLAILSFLNIGMAIGVNSLSSVLGGTPSKD